MKRVITYGTYDLLHYGHIRLLERAKSLGDYLIVGVTADGFDRARGKINVQQSLIERVEAIKATGLADKIIVEEYEGQKIDDIRKYDIDIAEEINMIKASMKIAQRGYPSFWSLIRPQFNKDKINKAFS